MGTKFAPSYACLTVGFLEEAKLFAIILPKYFNHETCKYIEDNYYRYMDDGFIVLPKDLNPNLLKDALNSLNDSIKFTMESGRKEPEDTESLSFLDIKIILTNGINISTDIYYKATNPHKYLNFHSAHPSHIKDSIPCNLAKRIIVFVSETSHVESRLAELEQWLLECSYSEKLIQQAFHRAKLQGPAPEPCKKDVIPLSTTFYPNLNYKYVMKTISLLLKSFKDQTTQLKFANSKPVLALKQPRNVTSLLTKAKFSSNTITRIAPTPGIVLCDSNRCKICKLYLQPVNSFTTSNGTLWEIRCQINCNSKNVVYFLPCNLCEQRTTCIGQTTYFRKRMNNHISESRTGTSSCNFPRHVHECGQRNKNLKEPYFKIYVVLI